MKLEEILTLEPGEVTDEIIAREIMGAGPIDFPAPSVITSEASAQRYSTDFALIWLLFEAVLVNAGTISIYGDMEEYGRGLFMQGKPECAVRVFVGPYSTCEPMPMALCRAALLAKFAPETGEVRTALALEGGVNG